LCLLQEYNRLVYNALIFVSFIVIGE
jgi:hypothetical protein